MKKTVKSIIFIIIIFIFLINSKEVSQSIKFSFSICIDNLFPSIIPFMLLSNIFLYYDFIPEYNFFKIFKINKNCSFIVIMSILTGSPSNAKYIKDMLDNNSISIKDAINCVNFCHFTNPFFVINTIGISFFNDKKIGIILLISQYISSFIIGLFNKKNRNETRQLKINKKYNNFITLLLDSIVDIANTLLLILGIITVCLIITTLFNNLFNINDNYKFIYGIIEVTQGLKYLSLSNLNIFIKITIASFLISFGGLSIHMQVFTILDNKKIRYIKYLIYRLIHGILSVLITLLFIILLY